MITVKDFLEESSHFTKYSGDSCKSLEVLNRAIRTLWKRGTWVGTVDYFCVDCKQDCFHLPYQAVNVIEAWAGNESVSVKPSWYMAIPRNKVAQCCCLDCAQPVISPTGIISSFPVEYPCDGNIGFRADNSCDEGKKVAIQFKSPEGSVYTETLELSFECATYTEELVGKVVSIKKDRTIGTVSVYAKSCDDKQWVIHELQSTEELAGYTQYEMTGPMCGKIVLKVKKRRIKITEDDLDSILPLDPDALEFAIQAVLAKEEGADGHQAFISALQLAEEALEEEQLEMQSQRTSSEVKGGLPQLTSSSFNYESC